MPFLRDNKYFVVYFSASFVIPLKDFSPFNLWTDTITINILLSINVLHEGDKINFLDRCSPQLECLGAVDVSDSVRGCVARPWVFSIRLIDFFLTSSRRLRPDSDVSSRVPHARRIPAIKAHLASACVAMFRSDG